MKNTKQILSGLICIILGFTLSQVYNDLQNLKIDLPEEWQQITPEDNLKGEIINGTLKIHFNKDVFFEWESLPSDIPADKEKIQISGRSGNIIYLNPIDE
jgi:hypothetical protein